MSRLISYLKRWLLPAVRQFKVSLPFLFALALLLLLIAIWWLGPKWQIGGSRPLEGFWSRITATVILFIIPLLWWTVSTRKKYQKLASERKYEEAVELDPCLPYLQAQERLLDSNLEVLKANNLNKDFLYKLPWYLVLGQEGSGKTSLTNRSNQNFSLTGVVKAGVRKTAKDPFLAYSLDWWVGNEAVLIDPPGEIISQSDPEGNDSAKPTLAEQNISAQESALRNPNALPTGLTKRLWDNLIDWLDRNRSRRPLNGIILVIDLSSLLNQSPSDRKTLAILLRARLFELSKKLGTRLPLYLVLTKFDLIDGFNEFFEKLPRSVREEIFGFTFTLKSVNHFDAWLEEFIADYDAFVARLNEQVFDAIGLPHTLEERERLFSFINQLAGMRDMLVGFLTEMLGSDSYSTPALVRGVYFSSVYQQGLLSNAFVNAAAKTYGLSRLIPQAKETSRGLIYFAQKLFRDIIYPEAGLAGDNVKVISHKRKILIANGVVAGLATLLIIGGWQIYYTINSDKAARVLAQTEEFSRAYIDTSIDTTGKNLLQPLNQIREAVAIFGDYREAWPAVEDMGLYEGRVIGPKVDEAYLQLLSKRFLPSLAAGLINTMDSVPQGSDAQMAALRIYRMIEDRQNRRPAMVENWMGRQWQTVYPTDGVVQNDLMNHLRYAMLYAQADLPQYQGKIRHIQQILRQIPLQQRVYMTMKATARDTLSNPLDLRNEIGPSFDLVFTPIAVASSSDPSVNAYTVIYDSTSQPLLLDALLTARGFREYFEPQSKDVTELAMIDQWVLGERDSINYSDADKQILSERINTLYTTDYIDSWRRALNQFEVSDFKDIQQGVTVLDTVIGPAAPFRRLLETVHDNSVIYAPVQLPASVPGAAAAAGNSAKPDSGNATAAVTAANAAALPQTTLQVNAQRITRAFDPLAAMLVSNNGQASSYDDVIRSVGALYEYLKVVQDSPDRGRTALQAVLDRFSLKGSDPISNLQRIAVGLPEPMNRHVAKLAQQSQQVLMIEALRELEKRWDSEIYSFYNERLASRYPFNPNSRQDVALDDFEKFFGPQGMLQNFTDKYLNVFLRDNLNALYSEGQGQYLVRTDVLTQLEAANRIRDTFFNNRGALNVQFTVQPLGMTATSRTSILNVDGQLIPYRHGPSTTVGLIWPNTLSEGATSKLTLVNSGGGSSEISYRGPWGLYRLLSNAQLTGASATSVDLSFKVGSGTMRYRVSSEKTNNPFTQKVFHGFSLPRTLLNNELTATPAATASTAAATQP